VASACAFGFFGVNNRLNVATPPCRQTGFDSDFSTSWFCVLHYQARGASGGAHAPFLQRSDACANISQRRAAGTPWRILALLLPPAGIS